MLDRPRLRSFPPSAGVCISVFLNPLTMSMKITRILALLFACAGLARAAAPTIDTPPNPTTNCVGSTASFIVAASGDPVLSYQWYFNETNLIADATNASVTISPVSGGSAGSYSVVITNDSGSVTSSVVTLTVNPQPTLSANSTTICAGGSATLTATTDAGTPGYLWSPGGATTASITVSPGTTTIYTVVVTDGVTGCTNTASGTVTVNPLPTVSVNSGTVCVGSSITLTATTGAATPSYLWSPGGATTVSISVSPASTTVYSVLVTDGVTGCTNTASGTVTVNPLPTVSVNSVTVCSNIPGVLTAATSAANPAYLWTPGAQTTASVTNTPTSTTVYTVRVTDGVTGCTNSASGTITVQPRTTATALTANQTNCPGGNVIFTTTAGGTGPFTYVWRKNGSALGETSATLTLPGVTTADTATYSVEVTGTCNAVTNSGFLFVIPPPTISSQPASQTTPMGNGAVFTVVGVTPNTVLAPLSYQWKTNGVNVTGATASSYTIANVPLAFNGLLVSVAVTDCGGSLLSSSATLTVTPITAISFDFNTPGQYTNAPYAMANSDWANSTLINNQPFGPVVPFEVSTGGVGVATGGGGLDLMFNNGNANSSTLHPISYDFSLPGQTLYVSVMMKAKFPLANSRAVQIGFTTATNLDLDNSAGRAYMTVLLNSSNFPGTTYNLRSGTKPLAINSFIEGLAAGNFATAILTTNVWYRFSGTFVNNNAVVAGTHTVSATLQEMGVDGTTPGALTVMPTTSVTNADITASKNLFFVLRGQENCGVDYLDNVFVSSTNGPVYFVQQPASQTVAQGRTASFRAMVNGAGPYTYQWFKNGSPIAGAGNWKYTTPPLLTSDNGALYRVSVTSTINSITSSDAVVTVTGDALDLVSVGSVEGSVIGARFDQPVTKATAEIAANYLINGVAAYAASLRANGTDVLLTPAAPVAGNFTVIVANVQSLSGTVIGANNTAVGYVAGLTGFDINPLNETPGFYQNNAPAISTFIGDNYSFASNSFEITGGGSDIFGNFDGFRYVYTQKSGDFDVKIRVPALDALRTPNKAGFAVRPSLDPFSPSVYAGVNPQLPGRNFTEGTFRNDYNTGTGSWGANPQLSYPNAWIRFRRVGNTFLRYSGTNGVDWVLDGQTSPNPAFPNTLFFGLAVCANVGNNTLQQGVRARFDNYGDFAGYPGATITITQQPANISVAAGSSATFTNLAIVTVAPAGGELTYVWQRTNSLGGWTNLITAGATNAVLSAGPFQFTDNGAMFRSIVRLPGALSVTSAVAVLTVTDSAAATVLAGFAPTNSLNQILVRFSENMNSASALNPANYLVTNAAGTVFGIASVALLNGDARTVIITTTSVLPAGDYGVRVTGVLDLNGNATTTVSIFNQAGVAPVFPVVIDYYGSLANTSTLTDLTNNVKFLANTPDWIVYSNAPNVNGYNTTFPTSFLGDNYGVKMYSYFIAPTNAQYVFWYKADDYARFSMNTNATSSQSTNPAGSSTTGFSITLSNPNYSITNTFVTPTLNAGQAYYMELVYKETGGGDGGAVMVTMTSATNTVPGGAEVAPARLFRFPDAVAPRPVAVVELYTGLAQISPAGNGSIGDLIITTNSVPFISKQPNAILYEKYFGYSTNLGNTSLDNYLGRIYSYFVPPTNGNYKFYMRSDDSSQLYLNTNANPALSTDPAGASLIGQVPAFNATYTVQGQNISLVGGQRYYMEGRWREGTGGDGLTVAVRAQSDAVVPSAQEVILPNMLEFPTNLLRVGRISFAQAGSGKGLLPFNPTINEGQTVTFIANGISGATPYLGGMWFKNGVNVFNNSSFLVTQPLTAADNGAVYTLIISNLFSVATVSSTVSVTADVTSPFLLSATASQYGDSVMVTFSETVDPLTASCLANYKINGLVIYSLTYDVVNRNRVLLRTSPQPLNTIYTLTVNGVRDAALAGNTIAPNSTINFSSWGYGGFGGVYVELFTNIAGTLVANLQNDPKFINNLPDVSYYTNNFGAGQFGAQSGLDFYGARVSGYFLPPSNGLYQFYIRSDDGSQLFMNTNGPTTAERVMIARNDGANPVAVGTIPSAYVAGTGLGRVGANASAIFSLTNGTAYYLEGLLKEGGGGDYMQVVMRSIDPGTGLPYVALPALAVVGENLTGGFFKAPGDPNVNRLSISSAPPAELTTNENAFISLALVAAVLPPSATPFVSYQWQRSNDFTGTFTNIPGATATTLSFYVPLSDDGATYRLLVNLPATNAVFQTLLHIAQDFDPPLLVSASSLDGYTIGVRYTEPVDPPTAGEYGNYIVNGGSTEVIAASVRPSDPSTVILTLASRIVGAFTVDAFGIVDRAVNANFASSSTAGSVQRFFHHSDVGGPAAAGSSFTSTNGEISVVAGGTDIWNASDSGHLTLAALSGNFDVHARVDSLTRSGVDIISKAGLIVRETTNADSRTLHILGNPPASQGGRDLIEAGQRPLIAALTVAWPATTNVVPAGIPNLWLRLTRVDDVFTGYASTNGVNWIGFARIVAPYSNSVFVGLGTTAHNAAGPAVTAQYKEVYFPDAPVITAQLSPASQTLPLHGTTSYTVTTTIPANSGPTNYVWRRNGVRLAGATTDTLSFANLLGSDSGIYTVEVGNDGGSVVSAPVTLIVSNALPVLVNDSLATTQGVVSVISTGTLTGNDSDPEMEATNLLAVSGVYPLTVGTNFNEGNLSGATLYGSALVELTGGVANSGVLKINSGIANQTGSFVTSELTPGKRVSAFTATFNLRIADGSAEPADGFSFNFAGDIPNAATYGAFGAEDGVGTGLSFCIDNYRFAPFAGNGVTNAGGGTANTAGMKIKYGYTNLAFVQIPVWNDYDYVPVSITLTAEGNLTVLVDNTNVFGTVVVPWVPQIGRFGIFARTGGQFEAHYVDDLNITVMTLDTALGGTVVLGGGNVTYTPPASACGPDTFYYLVNDGQVGGTAVGTVNVTVNTTNAPVIVTCATNRTFFADGSCTRALADLRGEIVVSGCGPQSISQSPAPGTFLGLGATVVTFTVTNVSGLTASCQATVNFLDTTVPSITCPGPLVAEATGPAGALVSFTPSASDNCSVASLISNPASGSTFPMGVTTVTVTATDGSGNTNACTFTVTVRDTTPPNPTCPAPIVAEATSAAGRVVNYSASATDAVDPSPTVTGSPASGSVFPLGSTLVTVTTYDASLNTNICTFTVTVRDTTAPVVTCSTNITVDATNSAGNVVDFTVSATDVVDASPTVTASPASGSVFPIGTTTVTVTAYDAALNTNTCTFTVTVRDTIAPVVTCPSNIVVEATNAAGNVVTFTPTATDNVDPNPTVTSSPASGSVFPLGVTTVTVTAYDTALNTNTCTFTVTIMDTIAPVVNCSSNRVVEATNASGNIVTFTVSTTDNVDPNPTVTASPASGSVFPLGVTTVTVTAYDTALNTNTCTFTVTVQDTIAPVIDCPTNRTVACSGTNGAQVTFTLSATDVVDASPTVTASPASGSYFSLGTNTVTVTASDASGNTNTCTFQIVVQDHTAAGLTIDQAGSDVIIRWPLTCTSYVLEKTSDLTPPSGWSTVSATVTVVDGKFQVTVPANTDANFYRLRN